MGSKMLIDAAHREETRVVVFRGNRIEEFDYESADRKQLKGNIYLAKVTRVEPSLQAAFVDYGGNRHGFLAFSEIHPDYYQIPIADREALLREEAEEAMAASAEEDNDENGEDEDVADSENVQSVDADADTDKDSDEEGDETIIADDDSVNEDQDEAPRRRRKRQRRYRIQEVIKRRQVILVQVVKEERGNKGAALTTYLSLAGRYCVLMPNTARGGGISRKINDAKDRKRLKEVTQAMNVPDGAGLIVRTAGASRTKAEIKRDFDYLLRLWSNIRELTLKSTAPSLVYEEGNLIKRSIRDLYNKDVDEVVVEGEQAYKDAKGFMKMLMPSHAKNVKHYDENRPLFSQFQVENQLDALYSPQITLPSGGYLVMNQTEALVSIDINSGKATREHSIEKTALKTNLEASVEIARQLRLRDLAGLVVIDFIDMEERRNNRAVERKLKESLKTDRARIQVGRISHFGLLEMSRQRMRQSMLEGTTKPCPHCEGTGLIRSVSSCALSVLRAIEDHLINRKVENLNVNCRREIASYILNDKREHLAQIEKAYNISIFVIPSDTISPSECEIQRGGVRGVNITNGSDRAVKGETAYEEDDGKTAGSDDEQKPEGRKRRRRRRGRRGKKPQNGDESATETTETTETIETTEKSTVSSQGSEQATESKSSPEEMPVSDQGDQPKKKGRSRSRKQSVDQSSDAAGETDISPQSSDKEDTDKPKKRASKKPARKAARKKIDQADAGSEKTAESGVSTDRSSKSGTADETVADKPKARKTAAKKPAAKKTAAKKSTKKPASKEPKPESQIASTDSVAKEPARTGWKVPESTAEVAGPAKKGWWSK